MVSRLADLQITVNRKKRFYLPGETVRARVTLTVHETFVIQRGWVALRSLLTYIKDVTKWRKESYDVWRAEHDEQYRKSWDEQQRRDWGHNSRPGYAKSIVKTLVKDEPWASANADFLPQPCEIPAGLIQTFDVQFNFANEPGWATYDDEKLKLRWEVYAALQRSERELVSAALPINLLRPPNPDELHAPATATNTRHQQKIRVSLPHSTYRLGTEISGTAEVEFGTRVKTRRLEVLLIRTDLNGDTFRHGAQVFHFDHRAVKDKTLTFPFSLTLPADWYYPTINAGPLLCRWKIQAILEPSLHGASIMVPFTAYNYTPR